MGAWHPAEPASVDWKLREQLGQRVSQRKGHIVCNGQFAFGFPFF